MPASLAGSEGKGSADPEAEQACRCASEKKMLFPMSNGFRRNDRMEYQLTFFLPETQEDLTFTVSPDLYAACDEGAGGRLTYQGSRLICWEGSAH